MPEGLIGHLTIYVHELEGFFAGLTRSQTKRVKASIFVQVEIGTEKQVTEVLPKEKLQSRDAARPNANWDEKLSFKIFNERMSVRVDSPIDIQSSTIVREWVATLTPSLRSKTP